MLFQAVRLVTSNDLAFANVQQLIRRNATAAARGHVCRRQRLLTSTVPLLSNKSFVVKPPATIVVRLLSANAVNDFDIFEGKLNHIKEIEDHIVALEDNFQRKQETYSAVGWETAAEIDSLFADSKSRKQRIKEALVGIKNLTHEAKAIFETEPVDSVGVKAAKEKLELLAKNLVHVRSIEDTLVELEANYARKQESYSNVGWETADEIDALFADSKLKKDKIKDSVGELKAVIQGFTMD